VAVVRVEEWVRNVDREISNEIIRREIWRELSALGVKEKNSCITCAKRGGGEQGNSRTSGLNGASCMKRWAQGKGGSLASSPGKKKRHKKTGARIWELFARPTGSLVPQGRAQH